MPSLLELPLEIVQHVVRHLDPVSLIALSQTSRQLRALIRPIRHDFVRRLLALELRPEHGGIVPLFDGRTNRLTPPCDSDEWKRNRYACCGCMKLLPHMMFDNHAILRLPWRKPPPGSVEAARADVTDWEPLEPKVRWARIQARADRERAEQRRRRRVVTYEYEQLDLQPVHPFGRRDRSRANAAEQEAEHYICGTSRHRRRCLECKYQRGHWSRRGAPEGGRTEVPLVPSRMLRFAEQWDRYFPGLVEPLPPGECPRRFMVYSDNAFDNTYSLRVARCPSCSTWQEEGAFRRWKPFDLRGPPSWPAGSVLCNDCHLATHRDPASLARELSDLALRMLRIGRDSTASQLVFGWRIARRDFFDDRSFGLARLSEYRSVGHEIMSGIKWSKRREDIIEFRDEYLPDLRRRAHRLRDFLLNEADEEARAEVMQAWFRIWVEDYDLIEAKYFYLKQQIARLEADPDLVLKHVLSHDPYRVQAPPS